MPAVNGYTLLAYFREMKMIGAINATNDAFIDRAIGAASRLFDIATGGRVFYPRVQTQAYDYPAERLLYLEDDLLELFTLTNGDGTVLTSTDYILRDANQTPRWGISLRDVSSQFWQVNADGSSEQVITINGVWGFRRDYAARGFRLSDTLGAALDAVSLTLTTSGSALHLPGQIIRIDNELMTVASCSLTTLTVVERGGNGSTAAIHQQAAPILTWIPEDDVRAAVEDIVLTAYSKRFGVGMEAAAATVTAAGVVLTPKDLTEYARTVASSYRRVH